MYVFGLSLDFSGNRTLKPFSNPFFYVLRLRGGKSFCWTRIGWRKIIEGNLLLVYGRTVVIRMWSWLLYIWAALTLEGSCVFLHVESEWLRNVMLRYRCHLSGWGLVIYSAFLHVIRFCKLHFMAGACLFFHFHHSKLLKVDLVKLNRVLQRALLRVIVRLAVNLVLKRALWMISGLITLDLLFLFVFVHMFLIPLAHDLLFGSIQWQILVMIGNVVSIRDRNLWVLYWKRRTALTLALRRIGHHLHGSRLHQMWMRVLQWVLHVGVFNWTSVVNVPCNWCLIEALRQHMMLRSIQRELRLSKSLVRHRVVIVRLVSHIDLVMHSILWVNPLVSEASVILDGLIRGEILALTFLLFLMWWSDVH